MVIESNPISSPPPLKKKKWQSYGKLFTFILLLILLSVGVVTDLNLMKFQMLQIKLYILLFLNKN